MSKHDSGKYQPSLIYESLLKEISSVREYGIEKYGFSEDWLTTEPIRHFNAAIRHIRAFMNGEQYDQESTLHHLAHAASNLMFEIERLYRQNDPVDKEKAKQMLTFAQYLHGEKAKK